MKRFGNSPALFFKTEDGVGHVLSHKEYEHLADKDVADVVAMNSWMEIFKNRFKVWFSSPMDIDFAMLEAFPTVYKSQAPRGPLLPKPGAPGYRDAVFDRVKHVLSSNPSKAPAGTGKTYSAAQQELFAWYKHLFVDGSKPLSHMRAAIQLSDAELLEGAPLFLKEIVQHAKDVLAPVVVL